MDPNDALQLTNSFVDPTQGGDGTPVTFTRVIDATISPPTIVTATCFGFVRNYRPDQIVVGSAVRQGDANITLEASSIPALIDGLGNAPRVTDKVSYTGFQRSVQGVDVLMIGGSVVRINLLVRG
jgi:hypothetical protein